MKLVIVTYILENLLRNVVVCGKLKSNLKNHWKNRAVIAFISTQYRWVLKCKCSYYTCVSITNDNKIFVLCYFLPLWNMYAANCPACPPTKPRPNWASPVFSSKTGLVTTAWDRLFFFTQGGNLMCQPRGAVAGGMVLDLDNSSVMAVDCEDRRYCFQITSPSGKTYVSFFI